MARSIHATCAAALAAAALLCAAGASSQMRSPHTVKPEELASQGIDSARLFGAIVKVSAHAIPDARSSTTLGSEREGTGVVIGDNGLILTIGYLIVEADEVSVVDSKGRTLSARVVGYDHATGFALLRTIAPFDAKPVPLGDSGKAATRDPVMIATAGDDNVAFAYIVSKRAFAGNWEYALDEALYTSPPTTNWSGAGLFDRDGKLLGVGSLIVREANDEEPKVPGNMFVPIELLKPILADLVRSGHRAGPARPWLGVSADEVSGRLVVTRVSPDGPADRAGIGVGDIILGVAGEAVRTQNEFYRKLWSRGGAGTPIALRVLQGVDVKEFDVESMDRVDYFKRPTTY
jgi:S1-C subfamily serine protease